MLNSFTVILKSFENMPEKMMLYIERNGTPVIRDKKAAEIVDIIREEQGYIRDLKGIKALIINQDIDYVIDKLKGIKCNNKDTSCPDQIAQALIEYKKR